MDREEITRAMTHYEGQSVGQGADVGVGVWRACSYISSRRLFVSYLPVFKIRAEKKERIRQELVGQLLRAWLAWGQMSAGWLTWEGHSDFFLS